MGTFLNAVKNLINSLTAKTSSTASTNDMVQLHDANGNPNGKISLADLASVLGGMLYKGLLNSSGDLNDKQVGLYICNSTSGGIPANAPDDLNTSFVYIGIGEGATWGFQIIVTTNADTAMYFRSYVSSAIRNWKKVQIQ